MEDLPKDNPVVTTYPLNGQIAVESGFNRVVHLICDNHPQHYLLVPGALNLVQTTNNLKGFLKWVYQEKFRIGWTLDHRRYFKECG